MRLFIFTYCNGTFPLAIFICEEESFVYDDLEITAKTVVDGRVSEVIIHVLDEEDLAELESAGSELGEEVKV